MADKKQTVKIDDVEYDLDSMSDEAKNQVNNLRIADMEISQLQARLGMAKTARGVYAATLKAALEKAEDSEK